MRPLTRDPLGLPDAIAERWTAAVVTRARLARDAMADPDAPSVAAAYWCARAEEDDRRRVLERALWGRS